MDLDALVALPGVEDVLTTATALYVIISGADRPAIFSDKEIIFVHKDELLTSKHLLALLQATSIKHNTKISHITQKTLFEYAFTGLEHNAKQAISHALSGTGGRKSLLGDIGGERIGRGTLIVPTEHAETITQYFDEHEVTYTTRTLYEEEKYA